MSVVIRLSRGGCRNHPQYRVAVADSRQFRDGKFLEILGYYNPSPSGQAKELELNQERMQYWVNNGAQVSDRVRNLVKASSKQA